MDAQVVRWHPFRMHLGPVSAVGLPTVRPEWGEPARIPDAPLPAAVVELLAVWRAWHGGDHRAAGVELERAGFHVVGPEDPVAGPACCNLTHFDPASTMIEILVHHY